MKKKFIISIFLIVILLLSVTIISKLISNNNLDNRPKAESNIVACHKERLMWMWNTRRKEEWLPVKASGANVVSVEGNEGRSNPATMNADLTYLNSINMKGMIQLDTLFNAQNIFDISVQNKVRDYINIIKNNPGVYGYFLADEPDIGRRLTADKVKKLNEVIKTADATHPTVLNLFTIYSGEIKEYMGTADIEGVDYYAWSGDSHGSWRASPGEFSSFISRFIDYYSEIAKNDTKENFVFIQTYKWTPGDIQPTTNINYIPTYEDLNGLLTSMKNKSNTYKAHAYYYWSSETTPETTLDTVPELLNNVARISDAWRNDYGKYPVEIGCEAPIIIHNPIPSDPVPVNSSAPICSNSSVNNSCRIQFYSNETGLSCFKVFSLDDCKLFNNRTDDMRYIVFGGNSKTSTTSCQTMESFITAGNIEEGKEYCANAANSEYALQQIDINFKIKYSIDKDGIVTNDKCASGGISAGGVCNEINLKCNKYDLNSDGKINIFDDFTIFLNNSVHNILNSDFNNDQVVDIKDFLLFKKALYNYLDTKVCN